MRKKATRIFTLLLSLCLLTGCANATDTLIQLATGGKQDMVCFDQMEYIRPELANIEAAADAVADRAAAGAGQRELTKLLDNCFELLDGYNTMYAIADIRYSQNINDPFYTAEYAWCDANYSTVMQIFDSIYYACAVCSCAGELERDYFWEGFCQDYTDGYNGYYSDDSVALMQRESELLTQYRELSANPTLKVDGTDVDYFDYLYGQDEEGYYAAQDEYYKEYNEEYARIYIELIRVRKALAEATGYDSYEQMQYEYYFERDYSPEDGAKYVAGIKEYLVPLYTAAVDAGAFYGVYYDHLSDTRLMDILGSAAESMGGAVAEAYEFMSSYGLYDVSVSDHKAGMSFQSYIEDYDAPFLFLDAYGDTADILNLAHELGHYTDAYANYNYTITTDLAECQSQALEYLALRYLDGVLDENELANLTAMKLDDALATYVQQASFAEFEAQVYALPDEELNAAKLNALSLQAAKDYGYYDGVSETYYAMSWCDIRHFFEMPFYIISYPVSNDIAMQVYALELQRSGEGLEMYDKLIDREYTRLMEAVETCGFISPFSEGRLEDIAAQLALLLGLPVQQAA